jgi:Mg2+ and Co2+ transporter CorA
VCVCFVHHHPPTDAELARAADEEEFLQSPEVVEDAALDEARAKLEYITSVLGMISSIEAAVPKVRLCGGVMCVVVCSAYFVWLVSCLSFTVDCGGCVEPAS